MVDRKERKQIKDISKNLHRLERRKAGDGGAGARAVRDSCVVIARTRNDTV